MWKNQKQVKVHGYYVKNSGREGVRIFTDDGCAYCKGNENLFVWANKIDRIWDCEKNFDWPKWSMFGSVDANSTKK